MVLWDPERLAKHPRLRSRAPGRVEAVQQAYEIVMRHLDESGEAPSGPRREGPRPSPSRAGSASLFEEVFSPVAKRSKSTTALWTLLALALAALVFGFYILRDVGSAAAPESDSTIHRPESPSNAPAVADTAPVAGGGTTALGTAIADSPAATAFEPPPPRLPPRRGDGPKLARREIGSAPAGDASRSAEIQSGEKSGDWIYRSLLAGSRAARELAAGDLAGWRFVTWEVARAKPPEYWISLAATGKNGATAHFVWSIDVRDGAVEAWNQEARDLEASVRTPD